MDSKTNFVVVTRRSFVSLINKRRKSSYHFCFKWMHERENYLKNSSEKNDDVSIVFSCLFQHNHNNKKMKKKELVFFRLFLSVNFRPFFRVVVHMVESFSLTIEIWLELYFHFHKEQFDLTYRNVQCTRPKNLDEYSTPIPISSYHHDPFLKRNKIRRKLHIKMNLCKLPIYFDCKCSSWLWILYRSPISFLTTNERTEM